jgi:hypothetical protein
MLRCCRLYFFSHLLESSVKGIKVREALQPSLQGVGSKVLLVPMQAISERIRELHLLNIHSSMQGSALGGQDEDRQ